MPRDSQPQAVEPTKSARLDKVAGAGPKEVAARAGHTSVSFTLDRYGHLYPEADTALRDRLDALYVAGGHAEPGMVIELPWDRSRPQRGPQQDERRRWWLGDALTCNDRGWR
jgi:hypothetical protein